MENFKVDLTRYAGVWYEVVRSRDIPFEPPGTKNVCAIYRWDGTTFSIQNEAILNGKKIQWTATVEKIKGNTLELTNNGMYKILMLDTENYQWAVVWSGQWLWILSRNLCAPSEIREIYNHLEDWFAFNLNTLIYTEQDDRDISTPLAAIENQPSSPTIKVKLYS